MQRGHLLWAVGPRAWRHFQTCEDGAEALAIDRVLTCSKTLLACPSPPCPHASWSSQDLMKKPQGISPPPLLHTHSVLFQASRPLPKLNSVPGKPSISHSHLLGAASHPSLSPRVSSFLLPSPGPPSRQSPHNPSGRAHCLGLPLFPDIVTLKWDGPHLSLTPSLSWGLIKSKDMSHLLRRPAVA